MVKSMVGRAFLLPKDERQDACRTEASKTCLMAHWNYATLDRSLGCDHCLSREKANHVFPNGTLHSIRDPVLEEGRGWRAGADGAVGSPSYGAAYSPPGGRSRE